MNLALGIILFSCISEPSSQSHLSSGGLFLQSWQRKSKPVFLKPCYSLLIFCNCLFSVSSNPPKLSFSMTFRGFLSLDPRSQWVKGKIPEDFVFVSMVIKTPSLVSRNREKESISTEIFDIFLKLLSKAYIAPWIYHSLRVLCLSSSDDWTQPNWFSVFGACLSRVLDQKKGCWSL